MSLEEEALPEDLEKLIIAEDTLPAVKLVDTNLPIILNPFYDADMKQNNAIELEINTAQACQNVCRKCRRPRRSSESTLDEFRASSLLEAIADETPAKGPSKLVSPTSPNQKSLNLPGVLRQPMRKSLATGSGRRKLILREPVLKALQLCFHNKRGQRKILFSSEGSGTANGGGEKNLSQSSNGHPLTKAENGLADFRDLVEECQSLLGNEVDFKDGARLHLSLEQRLSKNFLTMQPSSNAGKRGRPDGGGQTTPDGSDLASSIMNLSPLSLPPDAAYTTTGILRANHHNANTSCSQQAGSGVAVVSSSGTAPPSDDVTIDELASYFETLVHIPKKMSTMAEMMYI